MELPREVIKWLQYLNLSYAIKNVKDVSNGILIAEIINLYMPRSIHMNSLENGFSKEIKKKNWAIIKKVFARLDILFEEKLIINGDKNEIIVLLIKLYEFFNQPKKIQEAYFSKEETDDLKIPCYARPTIAQKVRESDVHDIVDDRQKMISTYDVVEKEEQYQRMLKEKTKQEKEKKDFERDPLLFGELERSASISTIHDTSNYSDYTKIHTLDSFLKNESITTTTTLKETMKFSVEKEKNRSARKPYEDESIDCILGDILGQHMLENAVIIPKESIIDTVSHGIKFYDRIKGPFPLYKFYAFCNEPINDLCRKFQATCLLNKRELVNKILDNLKLFNEHFQKILLLKPYQFDFIWKLFFPIITNTEYDEEIRASITKYLKQFLNYLQIKDICTVEILCNVIIRSLFLIDYEQNKELKHFCELLIILINNDKHICINILHMIKNLMSFSFFYLFLSKLLNESTFLFKQKKDIKDIFLYYIFVGLHSNKSAIIGCTLNMLYTIILSNEYEDVAFLSSLLLNITELNNPIYDMYLFIISTNLIENITENKKREMQNKTLEDLLQICSIVLNKAVNRELFYLCFLYSHKIIGINDSILNMALMKYKDLSIEEQKSFFSEDIYETLFKNFCNYRLIKDNFSNVFNKSINELNKKNNEGILQFLLNKNKWDEKSHVHFLKNVISYDNKINFQMFRGIYESTFKYFVFNLFSKNIEYFEVSKDMLNCFWHWPHNNPEINEDTFKISLNFMKEIYSENKHDLPEFTKKYFDDLKSKNLIELL